MKVEKDAWIFPDDPVLIDVKSAYRPSKDSPMITVKTAHLTTVSMERFRELVNEAYENRERLHYA